MLLEVGLQEGALVQLAPSPALVCPGHGLLSALRMAQCAAACQLPDNCLNTQRMFFLVALVPFSWFPCSSSAVGGKKSFISFSGCCLHSRVAIPDNTEQAFVPFHPVLCSWCVPSVVTLYKMCLSSEAWLQLFC